MAPVSKTLVAVWRGLGSSLVANIEVEEADGGSSNGPSSSSASAMVVMDS